MEHHVRRIAKKEIIVYDAKTSPGELLRESVINFLWGFAANIMTPFIAARIEAMVFISFVFYYILISYILNREKYETKLGRWFIMPVPAAIGAFTSYKVAYWLIDHFHVLPVKP